MIVLGIDPGFLNLGLVTYDSEKNEVLRSANYPLKRLSPEWPIKPTCWKRHQLVAAVVHIVKDYFWNPETYSHLELVAVEQQFQVPLVTIEVAALAWGNQMGLQTLSVNRNSVRAHFKFKTQGWAENKRRAEEVSASEGLSTKDHNVADAFLTAKYASAVYPSP